MLLSTTQDDGKCSENLADDLLPYLRHWPYSRWYKSARCLRPPAPSMLWRIQQVPVAVCVVCQRHLHQCFKSKLISTIEVCICSSADRTRCVFSNVVVMKLFAINKKVERTYNIFSVYFRAAVDEHAVRAAQVAVVRAHVDGVLVAVARDRHRRVAQRVADLNHVVLQFAHRQRVAAQCCKQNRSCDAVTHDRDAVSPNCTCIVVHVCQRSILM